MIIIIITASIKLSPQNQESCAQAIEHGWLCLAEPSSLSVSVQIDIVEYGLLNSPLTLMIFITISEM